MAYDFSELDKISSLLDEQESSRAKGLRAVAVDSISPDPSQPRKTFDEETLSELAESIQSVGIIQPPVVRTHDGGYLLISGERRWRAARQLGWEKIDVIVRDDLNAHAQLVENIQREALSPWEIYRVIASELDAGAKQVDLAKAFGKSKAWVAAYASVAKMPEAFMTLLRENRVSGMTALQSLYRLYETQPEAAKQLLDSRTQITAVGVAQASATAPEAPSTHDGSDSQASHSHDAERRKDGVAPATSPPAVSGEDGSTQPPAASPARGPQVRKPLPILIRAHYDNANWIVDYTCQREEADRSVFVKLVAEDGSVCFERIESLKLQSIDVIV
jgi:ParB family chromosome partitioning protein